MNEPILMIDVTVENFNQVVIEGSSSKPVLIDFWADWCEPCKTLTPLLEEIVASYQGELVLAKINCDEQQQIVAQFGVRSLPTVVLFKDGQPIDGFTGASTESIIRKMLEKHVQLPEVQGSELDQAKALYDANKVEQAKKILQSSLDVDNKNMSALILYARCLADMGELGEAETILSSVSEEDYKKELAAAKALLAFLREAQSFSETDITVLQKRYQEQPNDELTYQLAINFVLQKQYEKAMELLFSLFIHNSNYQEGIPRKALIQLFELIGADDPHVINYRRKLYQALY
ncbi:thioredoxin [Entomomonas moraniae]|uniref:Thioredoxin n=1 Tax=Entomomonas moraniae TaxID=2213226 RepID=A0A3Q9JLG7_9GAMM|nr:thioredoxin [Entomomonas moraniae]AZS52269.1 thioredoxin [Entomomonas moraniae]